MAKLGRMMTGGDAGNRQAEDFYSTPAECVHALVGAEHRRLRLFPKIWEPACGVGAICDVLAEHNMEFYASDIVNRGYTWQEETIDFLKCTTAPSRAIITNPPFNLAEAFIRHAKELEIEYMALLLKSAFWHAAKRQSIFNMWVPARVYAMTWRPDFLAKGAPTMDCMWCVWDGREPDVTTYHLLNRKTSSRLETIDDL